MHTPKNALEQADTRFSDQYNDTIRAKKTSQIAVANNEAENRSKQGIINRLTCIKARTIRKHVQNIRTHRIDELTENIFGLVGGRDFLKLTWTCYSLIGVQMMLKDLYDYIQQTPLIDTHEHLASEEEYVNNGPDVLQGLFEFYIASDLVSAGASTEAVQRVLDPGDKDVEARWNGIQEAWELCKYTGYGEATRLLAKHVYQIEDITLEAIINAEPLNQALRQPGQRLRLLKDVANLDHVQIDNFTWQCLTDSFGADFFLYDLSWANFCNGEIQQEQLVTETGIEVKDLISLRSAMEALFAKYGRQAIAVKAQHAYNRTLKWQAPDEQAVKTILNKVLNEEEITVDERLLLGDWGWEQGLQLAVEYDLPFKIHTGYLAV